jgi:ribose transport system substrate-binding protein
MANLRQAWEKDPGELGLPALEPPNDQITVVNTEKYKKDGPYKIAFASQGPTNSWAQIYDTALRARAEEYGNVEVLYADAGGKADKQVNDIEDLLVQQPDALIVTPLGAAVKAPVERAAAQNIPVVLCTGRVDTNAFVTRVDRDNRLNGALTALWVGEQLKGKGNIIMLSGIAGVPTAEDRLASARQIFREKYPGIKILAHEYTNWSPTEGKRVMEGLLVAHPKIDAIWSDSGIQDIGVIQAFTEARRPIPPMTAEPLNGFLKLAKQYKVSFMAVGYPPEHSARCLEAAVDALQGKPLPSFINVDAPLFTNEKIDEFVRANCSNDLWVPSDLPPAKLQELKLC